MFRVHARAEHTGDVSNTINGQFCVFECAVFRQCACLASLVHVRWVTVLVTGHGAECRERERERERERVSE